MADAFTWCIYCHQDTLEPTTTTIQQHIGDVAVSVDGVPAGQCRACGEISFDGKVVIPIDEAITSILIATGAMVPPTAEEEAALRAENIELVRRMGQADTLLDEPTGAARTA